MDDTPLWVKLVAWGIIIGCMGGFYVVSKIPELMALKWDWRCLVVECKILK